MKKLIIFSFGANTTEARLLTHLTELHFAKIIGEYNVKGIYDMGKDFSRDDGFNMAQQISAYDMESGGNTAHAIVCEYPSRNILEWTKSLSDCWGAERTKLYIRTTNNMQIQPLNVTYKTITVDADTLISDTDQYINSIITPMCTAKLNSFGEYDVVLPQTVIIESNDIDTFNEAVKRLTVAADLLQLELIYENANYVAEAVQEEDRVRAELAAEEE